MPSPVSRAGCPEPTRPAKFAGHPRTAGLGPGPDRRIAARRIGADRRRAAPRPSRRRRAVVADGGHRAVGSAGGRDAVARPGRGRGAGRPAAGGAPLAEQPAVRALLTVLDATAHGLDGEQALSLLTGPIGRVDPVSLRQLRRALRRADGSRPPREFADLLSRRSTLCPHGLLRGTRPARCAG